MRQSEALHDEAVGVDDVGRDIPRVVGSLHHAGDLGPVSDPFQTGDEGGASDENDEGDAVVEAVNGALGGGVLEPLAQAEAAEQAQHAGCQGGQGELPESFCASILMITAYCKYVR